MVRIVLSLFLVFFPLKYLLIDFENVKLAICIFYLLSLQEFAPNLHAVVLLTIVNSVKKVDVEPSVPSRPLELDVHSIFSNRIYSIHLNFRLLYCFTFYCCI